ncbi:MAG TPA: hypothetical protein VMY43_01800 [Methanothrix sp.]|nr:hypothetical protein [Methanothrix sp.]
MHALIGVACINSEVSANLATATGRSTKPKAKGNCMPDIWHLAVLRVPANLTL